MTSVIRERALFPANGQLLRSACPNTSFYFNIDLKCSSPSSSPQTYGHTETQPKGGFDDCSLTENAEFAELTMYKANAPEVWRVVIDRRKESDGANRIKVSRLDEFWTHHSLRCSREPKLMICFIVEAA